MHVGYIRVSSIDQNPERQREALNAAGVEKTFEDYASGKNANRPQFKEMMTFLREGDRLTVLSLDRLGRSLLDLIKIVDELGARGVAIKFLNENLEFDSGKSASPTAKLMLHLIGAFAEFERSMIRTRQQEGIELAKERGVYTGRRRSVTDEQIELAKNQIALGIPVATAARKVGISRATLYRYIPDLRQTNQKLKK